MVPRLVLLALVAVVGGFAGARLGAGQGPEPFGEPPAATSAARPAFGTPTTARSEESAASSSPARPARTTEPAAAAPAEPAPAAPRVTSPPPTTPTTRLQSTQPPEPFAAVRRVPSLVGQPQGRAVTALRRAGFGVNTVAQPVSNPRQVGRVIRQFPPPGSPLSPGSTVTVVVGAPQ